MLRIPGLVEVEVLEQVVVVLQVVVPGTGKSEVLGIDATENHIGQATNPEMIERIPGVAGAEVYKLGIEIDKVGDVGVGGLRETEIHELDASRHCQRNTIDRFWPQWPNNVPHHLEIADYRIE
jgi:hypothetical protein